MKQKTSSVVEIRHIALRLSRVHIFYAAAYALAIIIFDSWNLITHEAVSGRWILAAILFGVNVMIWYICRLRIQSDSLYKVLIFIMLITDIIFAALNVYWQRGMASKAVMLFAVPIISAGLTRSHSLVMAATALSTAAYSVAAVTYFNNNYGQGFKVELYGEIFFHTCLFFIFAYLIMISFRPAKD